MTRPRRVVLRVLCEAQDHPCVDQIFERVRSLDPAIALGTVYRTLALLEGAHIITRHAFGEGYARYELATNRHGHLIDEENGKVIEFCCDALQKALEGIAASRGYVLTDYHLKLWGKRE